MKRRLPAASSFSNNKIIGQNCGAVMTMPSLRAELSQSDDPRKTQAFNGNGVAVITRHYRALILCFNSDV
jgi:hypothetical protein